MHWLTQSSFNEMAIPGNAMLLQHLAGLFPVVGKQALSVTFSIFNPRLFVLQALFCVFWRYGQRRNEITYHWRTEWVRDTVYVFGCFLIAVAAVGIAKLLINAPRPGFVLPDFHPAMQTSDPYGFPSGHAAIAAVMAYLLSARASWPTKLCLWGLALWVMAARCIAGLHFPVDVLAGALAGVCACLLVTRIKHWRNATMSGTSTAG